MTGQEIYERAAALIFERPGQDKDYLYFFPEFANVVLEESLHAENAIRRQEGKTEIKTAPKITAENMNDEVDFSERLCRAAVPYGIAAFFCQDEGDNYRASDYRARFISALSEAVLVLNETEIEDVYGYGEALYS